MRGEPVPSTPSSRFARCNGVGSMASEMRENPSSCIEIPCGAHSPIRLMTVRSIDERIRGPSFASVLYSTSESARRYRTKGAPMVEAPVKQSIVADFETSFAESKLSYDRARKALAGGIAHDGRYIKPFP